MRFFRRFLRFFQHDSQPVTFMLAGILVLSMGAVNTLEGTAQFLDPEESALSWVYDITSSVTRPMVFRRVLPQFLENFSLERQGASSHFPLVYMAIQSAWVRRDCIRAPPYVS